MLNTPRKPSDSDLRAILADDGRVTRGLVEFGACRAMGESS